MGIIQSVFCSCTFCVERVLTWTLCAVILMLLMSTLIILVVYGISVGYHYAQKELASFAMSSRSTTEDSALALRAGPDTRPVVRLVAINRSESQVAAPPLIEYLRTKEPQSTIYMEPSPTPIVVLETERPPKEPELLPHERELARKLIGRFRRSGRNHTSLPSTVFFRPLRNTTDTFILNVTAYA